MKSVGSDLYYSLGLRWSDQARESGSQIRSGSGYDRGYIDEEIISFPQREI